MTIAFSQPVRNPVLHLAGIGGAVTQTVSGKPTAQSELHSVLKLTTPGLSLTKVGQGNNLAVTSDTITAANHDAGPNCLNTRTGTGPDASASAACGSIRVNGVATKISFDVTAFFTKHPKLPAFNTESSGDAFSILASTGEDFGDAPASYGAAWSVLSDVKLGKDATEDNAAIANAHKGPTTPDQADDGVTFKPLRTTATTYTAELKLTGSSKPGRACAWLDLDRDGTFDPAERSCAGFAAGQGAVTLNWTELSPKAGASYARVRVGYIDAQVDNPTGPADAGEVEDYPFVITPPPPPILFDDTATTPFDTGTTVDVLGNDKPGDPGTPLKPGTLCLVGANGCVVMVNVVGQAKYVAKDGKIDIEPVPGFVGPGTPVTYRVADANGTTATAKLTLTVALPARPVATPDTATTPQNVSISLKPLSNDHAAPGVQFVPASVVIRDPADATFKKQVVITGEGAYAVKPDGGVDFVPAPQFTGVGTTIGYRVADSTKQTAESTLTVTVTPVKPTANGDSVSTAFGTDVAVPVLDNDLPGSPDAPLDPASLRLVDPVSQKLVDKVTIARQGTYLVADGKVTFQPFHRFQGVGTPLIYQVLDKNGTPARAELTVSVNAPGPPVANPDTITTLQGAPVNIAVLDNDKPGPTGAALRPDSVRLISPSRTEPGTTLVVARQGPDGTVTVDPLPGFTGTATTLTYRVTDGFDQASRSTITVTITPVTPVAADDTARTPYDKTVTVKVLANDQPGDPSAPLVPGSLLLTDPGDGLLKATVTVPNEGVYTAVGGVVTFDPGATFRGPGTRLTYQVADSNGTLTTAKLSIIVGQPPVAVADSASTLQDVSVTVNVLSNDSPGTDAQLDPMSVGLLDPAARTAGYVKKVTVPNQGTYTVQPSGAVGFDPLPAFRGQALAINYRVADSNGSYAASTLSMTVTPVQPVTVDDSAITPYDHPITVNVLANDKPGDPTAPLVGSSLVLKDPAGGYRKTITQSGEGTYAAADDGTITFTPVKDFQGVTTPATYRIADDNGITAEGRLFLTVGKGPEAVADVVTTKQNVTVTVDPLANDEAGTGAELDKTTVQVYGATTAQQYAALGWARTAVIPGQGVFAVNESTGKITFDPEPAFRGIVSIAYRVTDTSGSTAASTVAATVAGVTPVIADDKATTPYDTAATVNVLANDKPGDATAPLVAAEVRLNDPATGDPVLSLAVPGEGTFTVQPSGGIRFVPLDCFAGSTTPVGYQVADRNGTIGSATLAVTVQARPVAVPDATRTKQHVAVTLDPLANDKPGPGATLDPASVLLVCPDGALVDQVTIVGQGEYVVAKGKVTFSPVATFTGTARPAAYEVKDSNQNSARATITVTVVPVRPVTVDDSAQTAFGTAVVVKVLGNDKPGDSSAPLVAGSVVLRDPADSRDKKVVTVPEEGAFIVDADGAITFTPAKDFIGTTRSVAYRVTDANGTSNTALLDVTVAGPLLAKASPDTATGTPGNAVAVNPLLNDSGSINPSTVCLRTGQATCAKHVTDASGTWTVAPDGTITLTPAAAFTGTAKLAYARTDTTGQTATAPVKITVGAKPPALRPPNHTQPPPPRGPPAILITLATLLTALTATLATLSRTRRH
ncbi:Ig-like domain-containing protein [Kribbella sp. NBC_00359]|uniref:Ig-like domain-containing protein n=1 Tax=Kribbella sp. NBC_00359 TaxID=2975966 RepID=UPI002E1B0D06